MFVLLSRCASVVCGAIAGMSSMGAAIFQQQVDKALGGGTWPVLPAMNDRQRPNESAAGQRSSHQQAGLHFLAQRRLRQQGDAASNFNAFFDVLDVVEFQLDLHRDSLLTQKTVDLPPNAKPLVKSYVLFAR